MASSADARLKLLRSRCPFIQSLPRNLLSGEIAAGIVNPMTGYSPMSIIADAIHIGDKPFFAELSDLLRSESRSKNGSAGTPSGTPTPHFYGVLERSSRSCRN